MGSEMCIRDSMRVYVGVWHTIARLICGCMWVYVSECSNIWVYLGECGCLCVCGCMWVYAGVCGCMRVYAGVIKWVYAGVCRCVWGGRTRACVCVCVCECMWIYVGVCRCMWIYVNVCGCIGVPHKMINYCNDVANGPNNKQKVSEFGMAIPVVADFENA